MKYEQVSNNCAYYGYGTGCESYKQEFCIKHILNNSPIQKVTNGMVGKIVRLLPSFLNVGNQSIVLNRNMV